MTQEICPNVLLVTQDVATTRLGLEVMASRGIRGTVVREAKAAADQIEQRRWDMAIVDFDEPRRRPAGEGDSGLEIVRQVKRHYPETPVIMLSRATHVSAVVQAMRDGCHDYLVKPVERLTIESMMDLLLPKLNGYDVCNALMRDNLTRHIPILIISTLDNSESVEKAKLCGARNFMKKPYNLEDLLREIKRLLPQT